MGPRGVTAGASRMYPAADPAPAAGLRKPPDDLLFAARKRVPIAARNAGRKLGRNSHGDQEYQEEL